MTISQATNTVESPRDHHTCPVWIGRLLVSPLRRLVENPTGILSPFVSPGSTVVDVGSAMGFHSLDLARLVGPEGRVVCLDIQEKMLAGLVKRARRKGLDGIIEPRLCSQESLMLDDLEGAVELVTAFNVVHETAYPARFLGECAQALKPGGRLLIVEPRGHVTNDEFAETTAATKPLGLVAQNAPTVWKSYTAVFARP
jgi:ubiquinone/menaquinone biosynthesis C-methylase UbiE